MDRIADVTSAMIQYFKGDVKRINHFIKVHGFARTIGVLEGLNDEIQETLEIAALTHDIGIRISEQKYNSSSGYYQQIEGPGEARKLLNELNIEDEIIERCCFLIAHHHTYTDIDTIDYQILVEADFLVNAFEDDMSKEAIENIREKIFRTDTGKLLLDTMYQDKV